MLILVKIKGKLTDKIINSFKDTGFSLISRLTNLDIIIGEIEEQNLARMNSLDFIHTYELDEVYEIQAVNITMMPNLKPGSLLKHEFFGANVKVAVIDTGVNAYNLKLEGNHVFTDALDASDAGTNGRLHGTYVAHIIKKIAPWCKLYSLKVANSQGEILKSAILQAIDWCVGNDISVVNISLGKRGDCKPTCLVCNSLSRIKERKGIAVVAMGNFGREGEGILSCPASSQYALTVGAVNQYRQLADYSSKGRPDSNKPDILAPGWIQMTGDKEIEGTSFAAPFISAVIACLASNYCIDYISNLLITTATDLKIPVHHQGSGLINIENMLGVIRDEKNTGTNS
ncbi:MAG: hypothetical protein K0S75_974 [Clostridia bacterium]|jgi:subtilisin family serine protease|nr:hypothetical protein [Clostridia bacterium]